MGARGQGEGGENYESQVQNNKSSALNSMCPQNICWSSWIVKSLAKKILALSALKYLQNTVKFSVHHYEYMIKPIRRAEDSKHSVQKVLSFFNSTDLLLLKIKIKKTNCTVGMTYCQLLLSVCQILPPVTPSTCTGSYFHRRQSC